MGIACAAAEILLVESQRRPFSGAVLALGRQDCTFSAGDLTRLAKRHSVVLHPTQVPEERVLDATIARSGMDDRAFFERLGFSQVDSLDASSFEGATIVHDLNQPIPPSLVNRYDVVVNGGTLEHVFDVRTALRNTFSLLKVGGRIVHIAPASNQVDHGFYSFSPTLFHDYLAANRWKLVTAYLFEARDWESPWTAYAYEAGVLDGAVSSCHKVRLSGVTMAGVFFLAEKTVETLADQIPQQGAYAKQWGNTSPSGRVPEPTGIARALRDAKRKIDRNFALLGRRPLPPPIGIFGRC